MEAVFLFPGQGSQQPGMFHELPMHPAVGDTLNEMSDLLGLDVRTLDTERALRSTVSVQLALLAIGVATARALLQCGVTPSAVAGLSVGAFAAAVNAEAISLADAAKLVRSRAQQMESMYPTGFGMAAIVGLNETNVAQLIDRVYTDKNPVFIGNINAPWQIVIAGSIAGMLAVIPLALQHGARKAELLPVAVPSHCPLLAPIAESLRDQLVGMRIQDPRVPYIGNVRARAIRSAAGVGMDLAENVAHSVRWHDAVTVARELGGELFVEVPPGHVLADLIRESIPEAESVSITPANFERVISHAKK